ncbi:MAG: hypothetical protein ACRDJE_26525 [Dehalococcoidia bacterium]
MNEEMTALLYKQAVARYPVPPRLRPVIRRIQLDSGSEQEYIARIEALMAEEPELARIFALRSALVEAAATHLECGDVYDPETDTWRSSAGGLSDTA